jgi:ATP-dependent Clp protease ATP-binding subunit ClpA
MTNDRASGKILRGVGVDLAELRADLEVFFAENIEPLPDKRDWEPQQTPAFQRVLQRATVHVQSAGKDTVDAGHVLASLYREPSSHAVYLLEKQGVSRLDVLEYISHGVTKVSEDGEIVGADDDDFDIDEDGPVQNALEAYAVDLTSLAAEGKMDPLIGRETELERTVQVLSRRRKNNPIYVGEAGVGFEEWS